MTDNGTVRATPRQINYWVERGWLRPNDGASHGTGYAHQWSSSEHQVLIMMSRLVAAGVTPEVAHRVARSGGTAEIADGITVTVERGAWT